MATVRLALAVVIILVALRCRRALAFPPWLEKAGPGAGAGPEGPHGAARAAGRPGDNGWAGDSRAGDARSGDPRAGGRPARLSDYVRAVGVVAFLTALGAVPGAVALATQRGVEGAWTAIYPYITFLIGGWVAGRYGGRWGIACALAVILVRALFPIANVAAMMALASSPAQGKEYMLWAWPNLRDSLVLAPPALAITLGVAMEGRRRALQGRLAGRLAKKGTERASGRSRR